MEKKGGKKGEEGGNKKVLEKSEGEGRRREGGKFEIIHNMKYILKDQGCRGIGEREMEGKKNACNTNRRVASKKGRLKRRK